MPMQMQKEAGDNDAKFGSRSPSNSIKGMSMSFVMRNQPTLQSSGTLQEEEEKKLAEGKKLDIDVVKKQIQNAISKPKYSVTEFYKEVGIWQEIARNPYFENFTLGVICLNAFWMAVDTDYNQATTLMEASPIFQIMEHLFCIFFTFEWYVRFMSFKKKADGRKDKWFVFDTALVAMMVGETWVMTTILTATGSAGISGAPTGVLRLIRMLRLSRMMRMLRSVPELLILVKGMASATKSVFYVMCLLVMFMYVFAIALTELSVDKEVGAQFFGGVFMSMKTLLLSGVFMDNLSTVAQMMLDESGMSLAAFFTFVLLGNLTIMNMLIGVLCEVVSNVAKDEKEQIRVAFVTEKLKLILEEIDEDKDYRISKEEFRNILENPKAVWALSEVGVDPVGIVDYADYIFDEMTAEDSDKEISFEDFMQMVLELRGTNTATVKDCVDLRKFIKKSMDSLDEAMAKRKRALARTRSSMTLSASSSSGNVSASGAPSPGRRSGSAYDSDESAGSESGTITHTMPPRLSSENNPCDPGGPDLRQALLAQRQRTDRLEGGMRSLLTDLRRLRQCQTEGVALQDASTEAVAPAWPRVTVPSPPTRPPVPPPLPWVVKATAQPSWPQLVAPSLPDVKRMPQAMPPPWGGSAVAPAVSSATSSTGLPTWGGAGRERLLRGSSGSHWVAVAPPLPGEVGVGLEGEEAGGRMERRRMAE
mmetsp:Transcript_57859/g.188059  ORF Transcript_57859/g.188059 Transcript_57859/m.188059 type:complete len:704 (-) Transcript_57859:72-2183(-)